MMQFKKGLYICSNPNVLDHIKEVANIPSGLHCLKLIYRSSSGPVGFTSDEDATELFRVLLKNAWSWDTKKNCKRVFAEEDLENRDPYLLLASLGIPGIPTNVITYHQPNGFLNKEFEMKTPANLERLVKEKYLSALSDLTKYVPYCREIMFWNMPGPKPIVFTNNYDMFCDWLRSICRDKKIELFFVDSEDRLPVW